MVRVLVADDCATARTLLVSILRSDPEIEVVGEAKDGIEAVDLTCRLRPHVVMMDIQMPRMDGFEATKEIMIQSPTPIVLVTGGIATGEVTVSMQALRAGAVCALRKPPGPASPSHLREARHLVENVKAMSQVKVVRHVRKAPGRSPLPPVSARAGNGRMRVVAIAASTGGPAALHHLFCELPGDFPAPILVVQHMSTGFIAGLATWLNASSDLHVKVAEPGDPLAPRKVYLAPDGRHLGVSGCTTVALSSAPAIGGFRPAGSFLFESVAQAFGNAATAVILTGMGEDGVAGLRAIRRAGGRILVQDEGTSVVFGMPGAAVAAGLADRVLPLGELPYRLTTLASGGNP